MASMDLYIESVEVRFILLSLLKPTNFIFQQMMLTSSMLSITASSIHSEESYMAVINQFHTEHSNANSQ